MQRIAQKGSTIVYYNSPAGYITEGKAYVDPIFRAPELETWLAHRSLPTEWTDGIYDRLSASGTTQSVYADDPHERLKACRIWQLKAEVDIDKKFIPYSTLLSRFGPPQLDDYETTYDGQVDTNDLALLDEKFSAAPPHGFTGHPLAKSDLLELYDESGSEYYYADLNGFVQVEFGQSVDRGAHAPYHQLQNGGM